ncbi:response regulator [Cystobacter fuscus]|uniref:response regulator n=1 Tax=Cystobacter fuscus TaxID=43 RepID=UPI0037BE66B2
MARLLIVEDHPELASLMVAAAESRGHEATAVHTGEAALALVRPQAFEAAVVDLLLPDMRGSAVLSALRDNAIPAIAVSGVFKGDRFAREATEVYGARAFFEKPFELLHLLEYVEQLCGLDSSPPPPPSDDDSDEVVVFEDASLMELDDEPGFTVTEEDEPLFAPAEPSSPVIQGLTVIEEARDPLSDERPLPPPLPPFRSFVETTPAFVRETPITLRTVELAGLVDLTALDSPDAREEPLVPEEPPEEELQELEALESEEEPPATSSIPAEELQSLEELGPDTAPPPTPTISAEELQALEALGADEAPPPTPAISAEELQALEALGTDEAPPPTPAVSAEELQALEALGPAEEPYPPAPLAEATGATEESSSTSVVSAEEFQALEALGPAEESPFPEPTADDLPPRESSSEPPEPEPEPGLALPFGEREKVWSKPPSTAPRTRAPPAWSLSGNLKDTSVPRLLNAYYEARHSGELKLRQGTTQKVVYFEAGRPVYAASNLAPERFLRFCVRRGVVSEAQAQAAFALAREQNLRSSEALARLGFVDARRRQQVLEEQVKEVLWSTFPWTEGAYGFSALRPPSAGRVALSLFPGDLILEGIQRSEPLVALRQHMPPSRRLFPSAAPPYALHELKLKGQQALLLAYADGTKTVEDLLTLTELPEREGLATLRGLELLGVLEERREEPGSRRRISFGL